MRISYNLYVRVFELDVIILFLIECVNHHWPSDSFVYIN
jgi:hypothetical protein